jgi:hypothetical protein
VRDEHRRQAGPKALPPELLCALRGPRCLARTCTSTQYLLLGFWSNTSFCSAMMDGLDMVHLYAANSRMSAQEEFILYDLRGWMVSFCTVSISSASSSWSNT